MQIAVSQSGGSFVVYRCMIRVGPAPEWCRVENDTYDSGVVGVLAKARRRHSELYSILAITWFLLVDRMPLESVRGRTTCQYCNPG